MSARCGETKDAGGADEGPHWSCTAPGGDVAARNVV
jgi:hypothetical protein